MLLSIQNIRNWRGKNHKNVGSRNSIIYKTYKNVPIFRTYFMRVWEKCGGRGDIYKNLTVTEKFGKCEK